MPPSYHFIDKENNNVKSCKHRNFDRQNSAALISSAMNVYNGNGSLPCSMLRLSLKTGACTIIPSVHIVR